MRKVKLYYPLLGFLVFLIGFAIMLTGLFILSKYNWAYGFWGSAIGGIIMLPIAVIVGTKGMREVE